MLGCLAAKLRCIPVPDQAASWRQCARSLLEVVDAVPGTPRRLDLDRCRRDLRCHPLYGTLPSYCEAHGLGELGLAHEEIALPTPLRPAGNRSKLPEMVANCGDLWRLSRKARPFPEIVVPLFELDVVWPDGCLRTTQSSTGCTRSVSWYATWKVRLRNTPAAWGSARGGFSASRHRASSARSPITGTRKSPRDRKTGFGRIFPSRSGPSHD